MKSSISLLVASFGLTAAAVSQSSAAFDAESSRAVQKYCRVKTTDPLQRGRCLVAANACVVSAEGGEGLNINGTCWDAQSRDVDEVKPYKKLQDQFENWVDGEGCKDAPRKKLCREAIEDCSETSAQPWASSAQWARNESCYQAALAKTMDRNEKQDHFAFLVYRSKRQCKQRVGKPSDLYDKCVTAIQDCSFEPFGTGNWNFDQRCYQGCMMNDECPRLSSPSKPSAEKTAVPQESADPDSQEETPRPEESDETSPEAQTQSPEESAITDPKEDVKNFARTECPNQYPNNPWDQRLCVKVVVECLVSVDGKARHFQSNCHQHHMRFYREQPARTYCGKDRSSQEQEECVIIYLEGFRAAQNEQIESQDKAD